MVHKFIRGGLLAGLLAGIATYIFARLTIEPLIRAGINYEERRSHAEQLITGEHAHEHEVFTRSVQENLGAGFGAIVFGVVMGALFAVAFTILWACIGNRQSRIDPRVTAVLIAVAGFITIYLVPFAAYPASPPGVGNDETIGERTGAYLIITILSVGFAVAATLVEFQLSRRVGATGAAITAIACYLIAVIVSIMLLSSYNDVPTALRDGNHIVFDGFPAATLADFRFYSVINQALLWAVIAVVFTLTLSRISKSPSNTPITAIAH